MEKSVASILDQREYILKEPISYYILKELKKCLLFVPPIKLGHPGTLLLSYSTLMSLAPIRVIHPGTDLLQLPPGKEVQFLCIVLKFQQFYNKKCTNTIIIVLFQSEQRPATTPTIIVHTNSRDYYKIVLLAVIARE